MAPPRLTQIKDGTRLTTVVDAKILVILCQMVNNGWNKSYELKA